MEVEPAALSQVVKARDGKMVQIDDDVQGVANRLRELHADFRLRWSENTGIFIVYQLVHEPDGSVTDHLVTTTTELDHRLIHRCEQIVKGELDLNDELDRVQREMDKEREDEHNEAMGDLGEELRWALRKDLQVKNSIIVPRNVKK